SRFWSFPENDLLEFFRRSQAALCANRVCEWLAWRNRLTSDLSRGIYCVLGLDGIDDFRNRNIEFRELIGLHPKPHGVLAGAKNLDRADSLHAQKLIVQVDVSVVGEESRIVSAL